MGAYNCSLWLFHSYISLLPFCSVCFPLLALSRITTSDQLLYLSSLFICYCLQQFPGTPAFSMLRSNVSQPCLMANPQLSIEYHLCPEKITFLSKELLVLSLLDWFKKNTIHSSGLLSYTLKNCRHLLPQFIKCFSVSSHLQNGRKLRRKAPKRNKYQSNTFSLPCILLPH